MRDFTVLKLWFIWLIYVFFLQVRATKRGRFDVRYYYDHLDRLATRKDNYGNVTQFFYTNHQRPSEVRIQTHSGDE
jgi:YD repeat-containing protein